jgi:sterol desaturase/sphingolipid hydroxylase (fatty acid hydroxylase superfamily)
MEVTIEFFNFLLGKLVEHWIWPFLAVTVLMFVVKGKDALNWSEGLRESAQTNIMLFLINLSIAVTIAFVWPEDAYTFSSVWETLGIPSINTEFWSTLPLWVLVVAIIVATDFVDYWNHRIMHSSFLWGMHSVHHSDTHMNFSTSYRVHYLEPLFMKATYVVGLSWLGFPDVAILLPFIIVGALNLYVHVDVDWGHGRFAKIIASPRYHQWHHANCPEAINKNFANVFPFWDVLFKTYYCPGPCKVELGIEDSHGNDLVKMLIAPFNPFLDWAKECKAFWAKSRKETSKIA